MIPPFTTIFIFYINIKFYKHKIYPLLIIICRESFHVAQANTYYVKLLCQVFNLYLVMTKTAQKSKQRSKNLGRKYYDKYSIILYKYI